VPRIWINRRKKRAHVHLLSPTRPCLPARAGLDPRRLKRGQRARQLRWQRNKIVRLGQLSSFEVQYDPCRFDGQCQESAYRQIPCSQLTCLDGARDTQFKSWQTLRHLVTWVPGCGNADGTKSVGQPTRGRKQRACGAATEISKLGKA
jgi:hypothetical protein